MALCVQVMPGELADVEKSNKFYSITDDNASVVLPTSAGGGHDNDRFEDGITRTTPYCQNFIIAVRDNKRGVGGWGYKTFRTSPVQIITIFTGRTKGRKQDGSMVGTNNESGG